MITLYQVKFRRRKYLQVGILYVGTSRKRRMLIICIPSYSCMSEALSSPVRGYLAMSRPATIEGVLQIDA